MSNLTLAPKLIECLSDAEMTFIHSHLDECMTDAVIAAFFDARGLPCPMPLLKAKVSLRAVADGESLYLVASDKNSQKDLVMFCQKQCLEVMTWQSNTQMHNTENYFHFIITKKASV